MSRRKKYPISEGWLHVRMTMNTAAIVSREGLMSFLGCRNAEGHEFAVLEQHGRTIKAIYRKKKDEVAA